MKSLSIFMALGAAVIFSGCSNAMMEAAGEDYLHANGYDDKST
jgi:PBP1b-binding outer membrane lipoprotein LpoB